MSRKATNSSCMVFSAVYWPISWAPSPLPYWKKVLGNTPTCHATAYPLLYSREWPHLWLHELITITTPYKVLHRISQPCYGKLKLASGRKTSTLKDYQWMVHFMPTSLKSSSRFPTFKHYGKAQRVVHAFLMRFILLEFYQDPETHPDIGLVHCKMMLFSRAPIIIAPSPIFVSNHKNGIWTNVSKKFRAALKQIQDKSFCKDASSIIFPKFFTHSVALEADVHVFEIINE